MLLTLRPCQRLPRVSSRSLSFTANCRSPRGILNHHVRHASEPVQQASRQGTLQINKVKSFAEEVKPPSVRNQVIFFVVGSLVTFGVAARLTNLDTYYWTNRITESGVIYRLKNPTNDELRSTRYQALLKRLLADLDRFREAVAGLPQDIKAMAVYSYASVAQSVLNTSEGKRMCYAIGAVNGLVWLAWQLPRLHPFMMRAFAHNPLSGLSYTMLTCTFSHSSFFHLLFNMLALTSFGASATLYLQKTQQNDPTHLRESTSQWHFLAFFISAGLFSSLVSQVASARIIYPRLVAKLMPAASRSTGAGAARSTVSANAEEITSVIKPSLGASGAIYAAVTLTAMAFPDTHVALIFPPTPPIPIQYGVFGLMAADVLGVLRGWKMFDHYAHLGGALFGIWYHSYGGKVWESCRELTLGSLPRSLRKE